MLVTFDLTRYKEVADTEADLGYVNNPIDKRFTG